MNPNKALWEKGDFSRIAASMRESGAALVADLGVAPGLKVLDIGCGDGNTALPAAVRAYDGAVVVHLSTDLGGGRWVVEVRQPCHLGTRPHPIDHGQAIPLAGGAVVRLRRPHGNLNPNGFDYEAWLLDRGIGATAHVTAVELPDYSFFSYGLGVGFFDRVELSYTRQEFDTQDVGAALAQLLHQSPV